MTWDRHGVTARVRKASDLKRRIDFQQLDQLVKLFPQSSREEVFEGLLAILTDRSCPQQHYVDQEYAGKLLRALKPPCTRPLSEILLDILGNYELSVTEIFIVHGTATPHNTMKKHTANSNRKLTLSRETVRQLTDSNLEQAGGGTFCTELGCFPKLTTCCHTE